MIALAISLPSERIASAIIREAWDYSVGISVAFCTLRTPIDCIDCPAEI
jgi:hypothetical protein